MTSFIWHSRKGKTDMVNSLWNMWLKYSIWYFSGEYLSLCICLHPQIFTTQQVIYILFKLSYLGYGSVKDWNTECTKESNWFRNVWKNSLLVVGQMGWPKLTLEMYRICRPKTKCAMHTQWTLSSFPWWVVANSTETTVSVIEWNKHWI